MLTGFGLSLLLTLITFSLGQFPIHNQSIRTCSKSTIEKKLHVSVVSVIVKFKQISEIVMVFSLFS